MHDALPESRTATATTATATATATAAAAATATATATAAASSMGAGGATAPRLDSAGRHGRKIRANLSGAERPTDVMSVLQQVTVRSTI